MVSPPPIWTAESNVSRGPKQNICAPHFSRAARRMDYKHRLICPRYCAVHCRLPLLF